MPKRVPRPKPPSDVGTVPKAEGPAPTPKPGKTPRPRRVGEPATYNLYEAKTQLSELVDCASGGEEIVIAKSGVPMARLTPLRAPAKVPPRKPGGWKGQGVDRRRLRQPGAAVTHDRAFADYALPVLWA